MTFLLTSIRLTLLVDLVLRFREYNDKEPDTSVTFKWELVSVALLESNLIKAIELKTDQTPVVLPSGWLFSRIADILGTDYEIPNPRLSARAAKPAIIWPMGGIQKRSERSKVFDCMSSHGCDEESLKLTYNYQVRGLS